MTIKVPDEKRAALIAGLRELADWLEQHPDAPVRFTSILNSLVPAHRHWRRVRRIAAEVVGQAARPSTGEPRPYSHVVDRAVSDLVTLSTYMVSTGTSVTRSTTPGPARWRRSRTPSTGCSCAPTRACSRTGYADGAGDVDCCSTSHREGCNGGSHQVKLVPAELADRETAEVQA
jgi:hypothetical protein